MDSEVLNEIQREIRENKETAIITGRGVSRIFIIGFPSVRNYRNIYGIRSDQLQKLEIFIYVYHKQVYKAPSASLF